MKNALAAVFSVLSVPRVYPLSMVAAILFCLTAPAVCLAQDRMMDKRELQEQAVDAKAEQLQYSQEQRNELSCSKQARRIHKIEDKDKRRKFIAECRAKREERQRADLEKKAQQEKATKGAEKALLRGEF